MIDPFDASHDRLRLAVARAFASYDDAALLDGLADDDAIVRTAAARVLQVRGSQETFEHVLDLAAHPRFERREIAAFVLGQLGTPGCPFADASFPVLTRLLDDPYREVRAAAAGAVGSLASLGRQPPRELLAALVRLSEQDEAGPRASVAFALGMIRDEAALRRLRSLADDPDADVRDNAEFGIELHESRRSDRAVAA